MADTCQGNANNATKAKKSNGARQGCGKPMIDICIRSLEVFVWKLMVVLSFGGMMADAVWVMSNVSTGGEKWLLANGIFFFLLLLFNCYARRCCKVCWRLLESLKNKNALATAFDRYRAEFDQISMSTPTSLTCCTASAKLAEIIIENLADDPSKRMFE